MDKTIDRWTDPDGNGYAFKDTVARAQNRATIDKMNDETADRKSELDIERKRIDNLIKELPATAGEYQQSKLVLHSYGNTVVKCTTTSGNYTNVQAFTTDQGGPLSSLYTKKSNYQIAVNKSGLYLFELRIHVNSLIANKRVELAPFVNDTRNAALASSYNTAGNFTLTQVAALPLWLSANDTVDFRIAPIDVAEVSLQLGDVLVYAIDWEDKFKIPDYTGYTAETKDIRTGADGVVYGTAGEAVRKQIGNLTEDLGNLDSDLYSISSNILDTNGLLENTAIKDWGNPTIDNYTYESAGKYSTRPIPVLADEIYKSIGYEFCYILFNSDGSFTTGNSLLNSTVGTIKIPNGIGYIVFMFSNYSNIPTGIMRVESEQETPVYKPYGEKEKKYATVGDIEEVKEQIDNVTTTEPSKNVLLDGVLLENTDLKTWGTVTINNYNYASTGKYSTSLIDCKSGDVFYPVFSNGKGSPSMGYTIFDANGNMIDHDWTVSKSNCVVPVGGTKAAFMFNNKKYDGLMLYTSVNNIPVFETTDPKEKYAKVETTDHYPMYDYGGMEIKMVGKILCIGDSYTEGGFDRKEGDTTYYFSDTELSYPSNLERITGCNVTNKGDGGKTCETWWNAHANDDLSGHKICIIQIGINDTNKQEDGWNSISDVNLTNIVNKVRSENNGIPIFIATLPNEWAYGTSAYTVTNERIRSIANTLGLFVIDFEKENGFVFARDILGGHPTSFGTWEIAREWANAISAYLSDNKALFTKLQYVGTDYSY